MPVRRECRPPGRYGAQQHSPKSSEMRQARHSGAKVPHRPGRGGTVRAPGGAAALAPPPGESIDGAREQGIDTEGIRVPGGGHGQRRKRRPKATGVPNGEDQRLERQWWGHQELGGWGRPRGESPGRVEVAEGPTKGVVRVVKGMGRVGRSLGRASIPSHLP